MKRTEAKNGWVREVRGRGGGGGGDGVGIEVSACVGVLRKVLRG